VNIAENRLVALGWSEIMGGYNTPDTMVEVGTRAGQRNHALDEGSVHTGATWRT